MPNEWWQGDLAGGRLRRATGSLCCAI
jgi:hypothetical protein